MLHDRYLDALYMVEQTGSFSIAAEKLFLSKATIIQQINSLENWLGFTLFYRSNKGAVITPEGKIFVNDSKKALRQLDISVNNCRTMQSHNVIRIGTLPNFNVVLIPSVCRRFKELYPDVRIQFLEYPLKSYFRSFDAGQFDITAEYMRQYNSGRSSYKYVKLTDDAFCCAVPLNHPLARKRSITLDDLSGQRMMLYARNADHGVDLVRDYLQANAQNLETIDIRSYDSATFLECELDQALLLCPSFYVSSFPNMTAIPLDIDVELSVPLGLGYYSNGYAPVENFINIAREMFPTKEDE